MGLATKIGFHFHLAIAGLLFIALVITSINLICDKKSKFEATFNKDQTVSNDPSPGCNLFSGRWVYDNTSHPRYKDTKCSFMFEEYACEKYGRKDLKHQNWRWQPHHCDLPRFNGTALLEKMRGKKVVFVGDSLNKNLWTSMLCLIESSISPSSNKSLITDGNLLFFQDIEYNATIGFYWSPFLVESNNDDLILHRNELVVRIKAIETHARHWTDADMLIFDSFAWWAHAKRTLLWGSFNSSDAIYKTVETRYRPYEMSLNTWSDWLEFHIDRTRTKLFFMSLSPMHFWGEDWSTEQHCYNQTEPILKEGYWGIDTDKEMMRIAESALQNLENRGIKVEYLNITQLSDYRKDALTILYSESNIQGIHKDHSQNDNNNDGDEQRSISIPDGFVRNSTHAHYFNLSNKPLASLDKFTTCKSTVRYTGRRAASAVPRSEYGGQRAAAVEEGCDLFSGKWVFDNTSYPLYNESACPFMSDQLACHKHGRPDFGYQFWRWQPKNCNLKRWNAAEIWEKLRGKRLMFVGDSLNRGQWISILCLLQSAIPRDKQSITPNAELTIFRAENYNATLEFLWAPLLVESNSDDPVDHRLNERIMHPDAILRHSSKWEHADILVFNSYLWWRQGPVKLLWSDEENNACEEISGIGGMELAMESWANWVASNVDPLKKKVFFVTMSPTHQLKEEWESGSEGNCYNEKLPIHNERYWGSGSDLPTMRMVEKVLNRLGSKVSVLNITQLSEYRKDGHPTIYRKFWEPLSPETLANPSTYSDCIHWCLPGVPDAWNELLFQFL
ncbi:hypothetical protein BUALT_Bualt09G0130100 [Buddleja alternifolia]|uniref:Trichome birefringence-like N-terminal domain-containing protein n=1 Tax=Buddleja alternifolia TaxID=168488 RepID=A0AAV6X9I5_9LAMI|nr:hypothetical protein BUALT_Bualt09G0130100 [Buddleja alternifolia]